MAEGSGVPWHQLRMPTLGAGDVHTRSQTSRITLPLLASTSQQPGLYRLCHAGCQQTPTPSPKRQTWNGRTSTSSTANGISYRAPSTARTRWLNRATWGDCVASDDLQGVPERHPRGKFWRGTIARSTRRKFISQLMVAGFEMLVNLPAGMVFESAWQPLRALTKRILPDRRKQQPAFPVWRRHHRASFQQRESLQPQPQARDTTL